MNRESLLRAIQKAAGCQRRRAQDFLADAITYGYITWSEHPLDLRKKIFKSI